MEISANFNNSWHFCPGDNNNFAKMQVSFNRIGRNCSLAYVEYIYICSYLYNKYFSFAIRNYCVLILSIGP